MPLYLTDGKLLVRDGALATSEQCCCGGCPPDCQDGDGEEFEGTFTVFERQGSGNQQCPEPFSSSPFDTLTAVFYPEFDFATRRWRAFFTIDTEFGPQVVWSVFVEITCGQLAILPEQVFDSQNPSADAKANWPPTGPVGQEPFVYGFCGPAPSGDLGGGGPFCRPPAGTYTFYRYFQQFFGGECQFLDCIWTLVIHE